MPERDTCRECGGSGEVRHPTWGAINCPEPTEPCPRCGGRGEI